MLRLRASLTRWLLTAFAFSLLLAWPLHEAQHAKQPLIKVSQSGLDLPLSVDDDTSPDGDGDRGEGKSSVCPWCLFHADHAPMLGAPPELRLHAEASAPPCVLSTGLPTGRCTLAAEPRGPPAA